MSDKPNLFINALNAFEFKEITEIHNAHFKMLLDDNETRPRGCRMTSTRQHLARLLRNYPRRPCAPSLIKSRFFPYTTNLLTVLIFLQFETPYCIHAENPRVPPRVLVSPTWKS